MINRRKIGLFILIALLAGLFHACYYDNEEYLYAGQNTPCDTLNVQYSTSVAPILNTACNSCHSSAAPSAGITTDNHQDLLTIVNNNKLWGSINHLSQYAPMPKGGNKLTNCELTKIRIWIDAGAPNN